MTMTNESTFDRSLCFLVIIIAALYTGKGGAWENRRIQRGEPASIRTVHPKCAIATTAHHQRRNPQQQGRIWLQVASSEEKVDPPQSLSNEDDKESVLVTTPTATVEYGVSFMGGDPCGSKYNDDPFDAGKDKTKPGIPEDVKARIAALAELKKREYEENKSDDE
mgnify:CR=1 FL=1